MYQRRRAKVLLAVLTLVCLVLITVDFRSGGEQGEGPLSVLREVATTVFAPVQDGLAVLVRPVGHLGSSVGELFSLRSENARLRERLERLEQRRQSALDLERENADLRELLDMRERLEMDSVVARTISLAPSNYEWTISIDAGENAGIRRDMPVVNGDGLVGRVIQVTPNASRVLLAIDPNFSAAARVAESGEAGPIDGQGGQLMKFRPLNPEAEVEKGNEIVTSPFSNSLFPAGIPIGTVDSVDEPSTRLDREVLVRPFVDFTRLDTVLVLDHQPGDELPPLGDLEQAPFLPPDTPVQAPPPTPSATETGTAPPDEDTEE